VNDDAPAERTEYYNSTSDQSAFSLGVLRELVAQPTAPFHEERVAARIGRWLRAWGIPFAVDVYGNIVAHYQRGAPCRPLVLMAHMDHPAFTIGAAGGPDGAHVTAALEGGVPARAFAREVPVRIYPRVGDARERGIAGRIVGYLLGAGPRDVDLHITVDDVASVGDIAPGDFGVWDLPLFEVRDSLIHARVLDDLAGCAAILLTLHAAANEGWHTDVYGVFTRAEEVGLVGARAALDSGALPREGAVVSLEASKALPGAQQGDGPVIRVGDRATTFGEGAEIVLKAAAERLGSNIWHPSRQATVAVQRQLMSGGQCEGSAAARLGYQTTGLAFPLGNYHNVSADATLVPETIHVRDYITGVALLREAARLMPDLPAIETQESGQDGRYASHLERLAASAHSIKAASSR